MSAPPEDLVWRPTILDRTVDDDDRRFAELVGSPAVWRVRDHLDLQLRDLVRARHPRKVDLTVAECEPHVRAMLGDVPLERYGRWVHYPWSGELVHVLPPDAYRALRSDRNRFKLTPEEQDILATKTVGVVGLSVGNVIAITLALEGVCGRLKLADFDTLELSNMNRIRAGVHQLALPKAVLAARQIFEFDPYVTIEVELEGLTEGNLDRFLLDPRLDILLDECDAIAMKFRLRERARELGIPVLMETSDRGMLDVERFDLEPDRPLFHGLVGDVPAHELLDIDSERKATLMMRIIGATTTSTRAAASLMEIDRMISAWPQLASDVTLGGASATVAVRRLGLGQPLDSGRVYLDIEQKLVQRAPPEPIPGARRPDPLPTPGSARPRSGIDDVPDDVRFVVEHAALAPSGGNCQPWRYHWDGQGLWLTHDRERSRNLLDKRHHASLLALGASLENLEIAAAHLGLAVDATLFPDPAQPTTIARIRMSKGETDPALRALFPAVSRRVSNRRLGQRRPLEPERIARLVAAARSRGAGLSVRTDDAELEEVGRILGASDRLRMLCPPLHREMMGELRWTPEEARASRDGIDVATLELDGFQRAAMSVLARTDVAGEARRPGRGRALEEMSRDTIAGSSAVGLLWFDGSEAEDREAWLGAGRAVQRVWLQATEEGLAFHPMTAILYMFELLDEGVYSATEAAELRTLRERVARCFGTGPGRTLTFLFRLGHAPGATARSLRLPLDHILERGAPGS